MGEASDSVSGDLYGRPMANLNPVPDAGADERLTYLPTSRATSMARAAFQWHSVLERSSEQVGRYDRAFRLARTQTAPKSSGRSSSTSAAGRSGPTDPITQSNGKCGTAHFPDRGCCLTSGSFLSAHRNNMTSTSFVRSANAWLEVTTSNLRR